MTTVEFNNALEAFLTTLNTALPKEHSRIYVRDKGNPKKYLPLDSRTSVYCFIDRTNGDILKAESYKKPATGARGNIYQPETYLKHKDKYKYGTWLYREHNK
jgi:hypothetical protein